MLKRTEVQALAAVVDRLAERFREVERSVIEDLVAYEHSLFADGRVRDYIPILVERAAKLRLSGRAPQPARSAQPEPALPMQLAIAASAPGGSPGAA
jgi:hypothetical protein